MAMVRTHELTYIFTQTREAQDTHMLAKCLLASLSQEGRQKVSTEETKYVLKSPAGISYYSGNLLLKVIILRTTVEGAAASRNTRMQLSKLDDFIPKIGYDITLFNAKVKEHMHNLAAQGQTSEDLGFNLMKAYKVVPGESFKMYVNNLQTKIDENGQMPIESLLDTVESKFKSLKLDEDWNVPSTAQKEVLALRAEVARQGKLLKDKTSKKKGGAKKNSNAKYTTTTKKKKEDIDRLKKPANVHKPVFYNKKTWYWCGKETGGKCEMLRLHKPSECKGRGAVPFSQNKNSKGGSKSKKDGGKGKKKNKMKFQSAYAASTTVDEETNDFEPEDESSDEENMRCEAATFATNLTHDQMWGNAASDAKAATMEE